MDNTTDGCFLTPTERAIAVGLGIAGILACVGTFILVLAQI